VRGRRKCRRLCTALDRLFLTTIRLKTGLGEVVDLPHSVESQDLSDRGAPVPFVPMDRGEEPGLAIGIFDFNRIPTSTGHGRINDHSDQVFQMHCK